MKHFLSIVCLLFVFLQNISAQHQHTPPTDQADQLQDHSHHAEMSEENPSSAFFMREAAGTSLNPAATTMHMNMFMRGNWHFMVHGYAFLNGVVQSGPRGEDRLFSSNHLMVTAERPLNSKSSFLFRTMLSLEPATVTKRYYPLLFQTGETAFGEPIIDGQHPHDLFMELSVQYAYAFSKDSLIHFYFAPVGDPALGPTAFPHRVSAEELPLATLSHHLQDSTHIANDVITTGFKYRSARIEFSGFHGAEPDEGRWDIDQGAIDSWSARLSYEFNDNWTAQFSTGRLNEPEALESGDIRRSTASVNFVKPMNENLFAATFIWGRNRKVQAATTTNSFTAEGLYRRNRNNFTARIELVDKDELFGHGDDHHEFPEGTFRIDAFTAGYSRDFNLIPNLQTGLGATVTFYSIPSELKPFYGSTPKTALFYFRIRSGH